jgi:hypothetical protein
MADPSETFIPARGVRSLCWRGDNLVKISVVLGVEAVEPFDMPAWEHRHEGYVLDPSDESETYIDE